jgi:L-fuconolactonase
MTGPIVDAHHHFWDPARADYPWMTAALDPIRRAFAPSDLAIELDRSGVAQTILVQTRSSLDETREFLATADSTPFVAGVIGWVDLVDPSAADQIASLRAGHGGAWLVGIRHQVHDESDEWWLRRPEVARGLRAVENAGLVFDLLVRTRELPAALETVQAHPGLRFVIDHLAKPAIADGAWQPWAGRLAAFKPLANAWCKVSGLVTEADWAGWQTQDIVPYVGHALEVFGAQRLLFGSDWPVCLLAASYERVLGLARDALATLSGDEQAAIFGANARELYGLRDSV